MFNKTANKPITADKAIPSCRNAFLSKSQIISGAPGQKNFDREEFTRGSSDILTFMSAYDQSSDHHGSVYPPIWSRRTWSLCNHFYLFPFMDRNFRLKKNHGCWPMKSWCLCIKATARNHFLRLSAQVFCFVLFLFENEHFLLRSLNSVRKITCCLTKSS